MLRVPMDGSDGIERAAGGTRGGSALGIATGAGEGGTSGGGALPARGGGVAAEGETVAVGVTAGAGAEAGAEAGAAAFGGPTRPASCASETKVTRVAITSPSRRPLWWIRTTSRAFSVPENRPTTSASPTSVSSHETAPVRPTTSRPETRSGPPSNCPSTTRSPSVSSRPMILVPAPMVVCVFVMVAAGYRP